MKTLETKYKKQKKKTYIKETKRPNEREKKGEKLKPILKYA